MKNNNNIICIWFYVHTQLKALKQNLLVKQMLQKRRHKPPIISESHHELGPLLQHRNNDYGIDFIIKDTNKLEHAVYDVNGLEDKDHNSRKQQLKLKQKQEMLERNRYS